MNTILINNSGKVYYHKDVQCLKTRQTRVDLKFVIGKFGEERY